MTTFTSIDEYISGFAPEIQQRLEEIRSAIHSAAPDATEVISYNMPAFRQKKVLVYFAAYQNHIGFYPTAAGIKNFEKDFGEFKWSKGAVQFPHNKPLPLKLVEKIVKFRVVEVSTPSKK